jgi:L-alanine-DL-glutamate epimerase-like enolase superfamily enzyme
LHRSTDRRHDPPGSTHGHLKRKKPTHISAAIRSFTTLESDSVELPHWQHIVQHDGSFYKDGYLKLPNKPGLGVELNEDTCRKHLAKGSGFFD